MTLTTYAPCLVKPRSARHRGKRTHLGAREYLGPRYGRTLCGRSVGQWAFPGTPIDCGSCRRRALAAARFAEGQAVKALDSFAKSELRKKRQPSKPRGVMTPTVGNPTASERELGCAGELKGSPAVSRADAGGRVNDGSTKPKGLAL